MESYYDPCHCRTAIADVRNEPWDIEEDAVWHGYRLRDCRPAPRVKILAEDEIVEGWRQVQCVSYRVVARGGDIAAEEDRCDGSDYPEENKDDIESQSNPDLGTGHSADGKNPG